MAIPPVNADKEHPLEFEPLTGNIAWIAAI
jgi:hypothetical protein